MAYFPHVIPPPPPHFIPPPPHFVPPPPLPPHVLPPPPPPQVVPPPPHVPPPPPHVLPPLPPHVVPPPPHVLPPPPPHVHPPPPHVVPPPPPAAPDNGPTVIIVVFASFGCFFFLAFCLFSLWCYLKKKKVVREVDRIRTDEHIRVKEAIVRGPFGPKAVVLSVEDDKHVEEDIIKSENVGRNLHAHAKSGETSAANDV